MGDLNERQQDLYFHLLLHPHTWFKQIEIAKVFPNHYPFEDDKPFHDSTARQIMTKDIRTINDCESVQKIIITNGNGMKLATQAEFERYIKGQFASIFRRLERTRKKANKAALDGQMKICIDRHERETVLAFVEDCTKGE